MDNKLIICLVLAISSVLPTFGEPALKILPTRDQLWVIQGGPLKLACQYKEQNPPVPDPTLTFYKDGIEVKKDEFNNMMTVEKASDPLTLKLTITKNVTDVGDKGVYKCMVGTSSTNEAQIHVKVFEVMETTGSYESSKIPVHLRCETNFHGEEPTSWRMFWTKDSINLEEIVDLDGRYVEHTANQTLTFTSPGRKDAGEYECVFRIGSDGSEASQEVAQKIIFYAAPYIYKFDKSKNIVQGDDMILRCKALGYPVPRVSWLKDDVELVTDNDRIRFSAHETVENGELKIYTMEFEDRGSYSCVANSTTDKFNSTFQVIIVRVKDKLAALWPFMGIVAEVIVLCIIIFIYEKKRTKEMEDEPDVPAEACANAQDQKGKEEVRQRTGNVRT